MAGQLLGVQYTCLYGVWLMESFLEILVVENRTTYRAQLKQALRSAGVISKVSTVSTPSEALRLIQKGDAPDIICISDRFERGLVSELIRSVRELYAGRDAVFILTVDATADGSTLTAGLIEGISGFLVSPYSLAGLEEVIRVARRVKRDNVQARVQKALGFYIEGLRTQLNELATHVKHGRRAGISSQVFSEMCSALKELDPELSTQYLDALVESFTGELVREQKVLAKKAFSSASYRVRKNAASRTIDRILKAVA